MKIIDRTEGAMTLPGRARRRWLSDRANRRKARLLASRGVREVRA
jgi:hypothetical protein